MSALRKNKSWLLSAVFVAAGVVLLMMGPSGERNAWGNPPPDPTCPASDPNGVVYNPAKKCCCDDVKLIDRPNGMQCN